MLHYNGKCENQMTTFNVLPLCGGFNGISPNIYESFQVMDSASTAFYNTTERGFDARDGEADMDEAKKKKGNTQTPKIYACATMWHETRNEMIQLLKSIFRYGAAQCA